MSALRLSCWTLAFVALAIGCGGASPAPAVAPEEGPPPEKEEVDARYVSLPAPKPTPAWAPPAAKKTTLTSGLTLWEMGGATTPLVSIYLMLPAGGATDPQGKEGLSLLSADMLDEGAGKLDALQLSDRLGELATDYASQAGVDYVLLSMDGLTENLEESLALLADIVQRPKLSQEEFARRKEHHLATAIADQDDPAASQSKALHRVLFGAGYASRPPKGTKESLARITLADVKSQVKRMTVPDGAHLAVAGKFDSAALRAAVEASFGAWKGKRTATDHTLTQLSTEKIASVVDFPGATQSSLAVVTRAGSDQDANYFPEEVMNEKVGGSFIGRINMNLREDKGYTYGAFSTFRRYQQAGYFGVMTNVKTETTGSSVAEIFKELEAVCTDRPLTDHERNEAVEGMLLGFPLQFDQVGSLGLRLITLPIHNRPADFWETWPEKVTAVTTELANQAAAPFCKTEQYSVVLAGDANVVTPLLAAQGFTVALLDRDGLPVKGVAADQPKK